MKKLQILVWIGILVSPLFSQGNLSLSFTEIGGGEIRSAGFELEKSRDIYIEAVGASYNSKAAGYRYNIQDADKMSIYAWILNSHSRELAWRMNVHNTEHIPTSRGGTLRKFAGKLRLPAGRYEVYLTAEKHSNYLLKGDGGFPSFGRLLEYFLHGEEAVKSYEDSARLLIQGIDRVYSEADLHRYQQEQKKEAIVAITNVKNSEFLKQRFVLTEAGDVEVYGLGEAIEGREYDYGWIMDDSRQKKIWEMAFEEGESAGGAAKNLLWRKVLTLKPGTYSVYYMSDGSHSAQGWKESPPHDPAFWGIVLRGVEKRFKAGSVREIPVDEPPVLVDFTRMGNNSLIQNGFEVKNKAAKIRVQAMGEGINGRMFDYGWIIDTSTGKPVWMMLFAKTFHAGGDPKNRGINEIITLKPGIYWLYFITDDSHAFQAWNRTAPSKPEQWGIRVSILQENYQEKDVVAFRQSSLKPLVEIVQIGDDQLVKKNFEIKKETFVRIHALGEGWQGHMVDYGWIINVRSGQPIWQMKYSETQHAGGALRNRWVDKFIRLPGGKYQAAYKTNASHSYARWGEAKPILAERWGITLYPVENRSRDAATLAERHRQADKMAVLKTSMDPLASSMEVPLSADQAGAAPAEKERVIAQITKMGNNQHIRRQFQLKKESNVRIYAVGEGSWEEMYDYGWIESASSREVVWIMEYDKTHWAGGGHKNRRLDTMLTLSAGKYWMHFVTDDFHSYQKWDNVPPDDSERYGITLYLFNE